MRGMVFILVAVIGLLAFTAGGSAYTLRHPKHEHCRTHYVRTHHGRQTFCVKPRSLAKPVAKPPPAVVSTLPTVSTSPRVTPYIEKIVQKYLTVTYRFGVVIPGLTHTEGQLIVESDGQVMRECRFNTESGLNQTCSVDYAVFGNHTVTLRFLSIPYGVATTTRSVEVEPQLQKITRVALWGTSDSWGNVAMASMLAEKGGAAVTLIAPSFEGAKTVGLEDKQGLSCQATVLNDTSAVCVILDPWLLTPEGEHAPLIYHYPGGSTSTATCLLAGNLVEISTPWQRGDYYVEVSKNPSLGSYNPCS